MNVEQLAPPGTQMVDRNYGTLLSEPMKFDSIWGSIPGEVKDFFLCLSQSPISCLLTRSRHFMGSLIILQNYLSDPSFVSR